MIPNRKAVVSIGLLVIAGTVQAQTFINTCPFAITSPGRYVLAADLICGGGDGITITSGGVTLALEGHRITAGEGAKQAIRVQSSQIPPLPLFDVHILGPGLITNSGENTFSAGVFLSFAQPFEVSGITVLGSDTGIFPADSNGTITANTLGRNRVGISLSDCPLITVSDNDVSGNGTGLFITSGRISDAVTLSHNVLNGNNDAGVSIDDGGQFTVQNNVINGNGRYGIVRIFGVVFVTNNTLLANGIFDLNGVCGSGNTFFTSNPSCPH